MEKVVWGIAGAGDVCESKSAPAMYKIAHSEVKTVMRRDEVKAQDFAFRHGIPNFTTNYDDLLNDPDINAIYIATPPASHAELAIKAAKAGKAVYVEKPMANTLEECKAMIEACHIAKVPLFVAYYRRALPGFLKVKELIEIGAIGEVRTVNIQMYKALTESDLNNDSTNWRVDPTIAGGGYFHDLASHQFDYLDYLFGKITQANGIAANQAHVYKSDDVVTATFRFENGVVGSGMWLFTADSCSEKDTITIVGSQGEITFNCFGYPMLIELKNALNGTQKFEFCHDQPIQQSLVQLIVDELRGQGVAPSTGITGIRTSWVMDQITH